MVKKYAFPGLLLLAAAFLLAMVVGAWELQQPAQFSPDPDQVHYIEWRLYQSTGPRSGVIPEWNETRDLPITERSDIEFVCETLSTLYLEEYPNPTHGEPKWYAYALFRTYGDCFVFHLKNGSTQYFRWGTNLVNFDNHWCFAVGGKETGYEPISNLFNEMYGRLKDAKTAE